MDKPREAPEAKTTDGRSITRESMESFSIAPAPAPHVVEVTVITKARITGFTMDALQAIDLLYDLMGVLQAYKDAQTNTEA